MESNLNNPPTLDKKAVEAVCIALARVDAGLYLSHGEKALLREVILQAFDSVGLGIVEKKSVIPQWIMARELQRIAQRNRKLSESKSPLGAGKKRPR